MAKGSSLSKTFIWIILGLLILGLGGFGVTGFGGTLRTVGWVGSQPITVDDYYRELQRSMRAFEARTGQPLTMEQVQLFGIDRQALAQLVSLAALDEEVAKIGISVGDETVRREVLNIPAFHGLDGNFDREAYSFSLEQAGLSEAGFEEDLRAESARTLVQGAIVSGVEMPSIFTETLIDYRGERRSFTWAPLTAEADLTEPIPEPQEAELRAFYDDNPDRFRLPETRQITYVVLTPDMLLDRVEVEEDALRSLYDDRFDAYNLPERRLVERLVFGDEQQARDAMARIEEGVSTFDLLVQERGLTLTDIDLGDLTREDLEDAAETVFAADTGGVVGPLPSPLGPALFRVNGTLAAQVTRFEDALPELRDMLAADRARHLVETQARPIDDLLAGGATLEDVANETDAELGTIDWTALLTEGLAAYDGFRQAAARVTAEDYPEVAFLEDGSLFALRLDDTLPERQEPFDSAEPGVAAAWRAAAIQSALEEKAAAAVQKLATAGDFNEAGLAARVENGLMRRAFLDGTAPDFMTQVFDMELDEVRVIVAGPSVQVVQLNAIQPAEETGELRAFREAAQREASQEISSALFQAYITDAQRRANPQIDQQAINAVQTSITTGGGL